MKNTNKPPIIHQLETEEKNNSMKIYYLIPIILLTIIIGVFTGFILSRLKPSSKNLSGDVANSKETVGIADKKTFKDSVEGVLKEGGIDGEGNFHLERPGGISQNVYLTSSTVDLSLYIGKKVKVWGATFKGEKAGWLMDVGLVEIH